MAQERLYPIDDRGININGYLLVSFFDELTSVVLEEPLTTEAEYNKSIAWFKAYEEQTNLNLQMLYDTIKFCSALGGGPYKKQEFDFYRFRNPHKSTRFKTI